MILVDTAVAKSPPANAGDAGDVVWSLGRKILWRRKWQPTSVFLLGQSHAQRSLVGYSPWGRGESDMTEQLGTQLSFQLAGQSWCLSTLAHTESSMRSVSVVSGSL